MTKAAPSAKELLGRDTIAQTADHVFALSLAAKVTLDNLPTTDSAVDADTGLPGLLLAAHKVFADAGGAGIYTEQSKKFLHKASIIAGACVNSADAAAQALKLARGNHSSRRRAE